MSPASMKQDTKRDRASRPLRKDTATIYRRLDKAEKEIRLLLVKAGDFGKPVHCEVRYASLREQTQATYETLSYVWGNPSIRAAIYIEDHEMNVPASSERVLRHMRYTDQDRIVWIDAVCINQDDVEERNQQVAMMAEIYSNTLMNLIWLGESDAQTELAVTAINKVLEDARQETDDFQYFFQTVVDTKKDAWSSPSRGFQVEIDFEPLLRYFASTWFERLWVVQEAVLSPQSLCHYGKVKVPLLDVARAAMWLSYKRDYLPFRWTDKPGLNGAQKIWAYADAEYGVYDYNSKLAGSLLGILGDLQDFQAHEPRDHVYGLLGLFQKHQPTSTLPALLRPDYEKPLLQVLRDATRYALNERQDLEALSWLSHQPGQPKTGPEVSSWVPRWDLPWNYAQDPAQFSRHFKCYDEHDKQRPAPTSAPTSENLDLIAVEGITVDIVSRILVSPNGDSPPAAYVEVLQVTEEALAGYNHEHRDMIIASTLIAATDYQRQLVSPAAAMESYYAWSRTLKETGALPLRLRELSSAAEVPEASVRKGAEYRQAFSNACYDRSIILTSSGRLGVGPKTAEVHDRVAILWGCKWPVVLRPLEQKDEYAVVGVSYVSDIMQGEAVRKCEALASCEEVFCLR